MAYRLSFVRDTTDNPHAEQRTGPERFLLREDVFGGQLGSNSGIARISLQNLIP